MKPIELLKEHCEFNSPYDCYVLLAVSRKKDTPSITNSQEIIFREVIKNENDIIRKYNKIKAQIVNYKDENDKSYPFYLYVSLNARDSLKATFLLQSKINNWIQQTINGVDMSKMFKKVYGHFYSTLMMKESRTSSQKYFMVDFDSNNVNSYLYFKEELRRHTDIILETITRNGYHIKVKPFDLRLLQDVNFEEEYNIERPDFEVKRDANFFVEYIENE